MIKNEVCSYSFEDYDRDDKIVRAVKLNGLNPDYPVQIDEKRDFLNKIGVDLSENEKRQGYMGVTIAFRARYHLAQARLKELEEGRRKVNLQALLEKAPKLELGD